MKDDLIDLRQSTRERNQSLWLNLDWAGLLLPVADQEALWNQVRADLIEQNMIIIDETWLVKEFDRDTTAQLELRGIAQEQHIADLKVVLGYEVLAIRKATADYVLAVHKYDATVRELLMSAREYAAQVGLKQLILEGAGLIWRLTGKS